MELLSIRSNDIAFTMGATGPLLERADNVTIKLPKDISNANIPMKIELISKAVIGATSLPIYSGTPVFINSGGYQGRKNTKSGRCHFTMPSTVRLMTTLPLSPSIP